MGSDFSNSTWWILAGIVGGLTVLAILSPWRFWWGRKYCPQCKRLLPRWGCWGWKDGWTCRRCGCEIGR
ncbi:MAG TPA: hypothetical protein VG013_05400 [Gemmataceae bacterium]|jgi:hypothetical protein|nr:hypothetical protein [Gemmataceae bacterium]